MDELHRLVLRQGHRRVGGHLGEDAGAAEQFGAARGGVGVHRGEPGDEADGAAGAEDGGRPGEVGGFEAEFAEAADESAAARGAVEGAQFGGAVLHGPEFAVADLGEEFHGVIRVAAGDGPDLAAERVVGLGADGGAGESGGGLRGERAEVADRAARGGDLVQEAGAVAVGLAGPAGDHDEHGQVGQALGERGEPAQGLQVGPVGVVDEQDERPVAGDEAAHREHESVADVTRVGAALAGLHYAEGGAGDVVPGGEVLAGLVRGEVGEGGLEELPQDVERDGPEGLARAGRPDHAAAPFGDAAYLGEQCGLAESGLAAEEEEAAGGRPVGAQQLDRLGDGGDLRFPLPQVARGGRLRPSLRHPDTSTGRPNAVRTTSVVARTGRWRPLRAGAAPPGEQVRGPADGHPARPAGLCSAARQLGSRHRLLTRNQINL